MTLYDVPHTEEMLAKVDSLRKSNREYDKERRAVSTLHCMHTLVCKCVSTVADPEIVKGGVKVH